MDAGPSSSHQRLMTLPQMAQTMNGFGLGFRLAYSIHFDEERLLVQLL